MVTIIQVLDGETFLAVRNGRAFRVPWVAMVTTPRGVHWWVRADRDRFYRRRADAIANRNGISGARMYARFTRDRA